ncbi:DUF58 domain-containing protein [Microbacterium album]|uniref:DUF58 domain-containing protein n=1 Tax=Microbacterium album TaxID=2053191 RepID=A0A917IGM1_9MICO|nr:DUF58 domain-containing protein [Microbacterium album]GGH50355.1 hypothetical protein GCM10010921_29060 [Microbacterium album]
MATLLTRVKSRLFIPSSRKSLHALEGAHASLLRGRSLDFEDLRAYEHGDDIRDIDWRATARLSTLLVKRSRATRMHTVLFVVDTGRGMAALAPDERPKKDLAILAVGALGVLTLRHGDDFSVLHGDAAGVRRTPARRSEGALEHALRAIDAAAAPHAAASARDELLRAVVRSVSRRMIVVVVTDEQPLGDETERLLRRLRVQHDLLWITVRDADPVLAAAPRSPARAERRDVDSGWAVPAFLHGDDAVVRELREQREAEDARRGAALDALGIGHAALGSHDDAVPQLLRLLHRRADVGTR